MRASELVCAYIKLFVIQTTCIYVAINIIFPAMLPTFLVVFFCCFFFYKLIERSVFLSFVLFLCICSSPHIFSLFSSLSFSFGLVPFLSFFFPLFPSLSVSFLFFPFLPVSFLFYAFPLFTPLQFSFRLFLFFLRFPSLSFSFLLLPFLSFALLHAFRLLFPSFSPFFRRSSNRFLLGFSSIFLSFFVDLPTISHRSFTRFFIAVFRAIIANGPNISRSRELFWST